MFWYSPSSAPSLNTRTWLTREAGSPASRMIHIPSRSRIGAAVRWKASRFRRRRPRNRPCLSVKLKRTMICGFFSTGQYSKLPLRRQEAAGKLWPSKLNEQGTQR
jgi:hypothetical protein